MIDGDNFKGPKKIGEITTNPPSPWKLDRFSLYIMSFIINYFSAMERVGEGRGREGGEEEVEEAV